MAGSFRSRLDRHDNCLGSVAAALERRTGEAEAVAVHYCSKVAEADQTPSLAVVGHTLPEAVGNACFVVAIGLGRVHAVDAGSRENTDVAEEYALGSEDRLVVDHSRTVVLCIDLAGVAHACSLGSSLVLASQQGYYFARELWTQDTCPSPA